MLQEAKTKLATPVHKRLMVVFFAAKFSFINISV
jgi:hypothetical protein